MVLIFLLCLTQILWLAIDPFVYKDVLTRSLERLLFEAAYSINFVIYAIIFWVWHFIYHELNVGEKRSCYKALKMSCVKIIVCVASMLAVTIQILTSILKGYRNKEYRHVIVWTYTAFFFMELIYAYLTGIVFSFYGSALYKKIMNQERFINSKPAAQVKEEHKQKFERKRGLKHRASTHAPESGVKGIVMGVTRAMTGEALPNFLMKPRTVKSCPQRPELVDISEEVDVPPLVRDLGHDERQGQDIIPEKEPEKLFCKMDIERKGCLKKTDTIQSSSEDDIELPTIEPIKRQKVQKAVSFTLRDVIKERKIKNIVARDQCKFETIEKKELRTTDLASDVSIIISNTQGFVWEVPDEEQIARKKKAAEEQEKKREELKKSVQLLKKSSTSSSTLSERRPASQTELYEKKLYEDPDYINYQQEITQSDKVIIKRITGLTVAAIMLAVFSAIFTLVVFSTSLLKNELAVLIFMWINSVLIISAIVTIVMLFSSVNNQRKENLRLLARIGQNSNRINKLYQFKLPPDLKEDNTKRELEKRINFVTTRHPYFLQPSV